MIQISYLIIHIAQTFTCTVLQEKHFQKIPLKTFTSSIIKRNCVQKINLAWFYFMYFSS